jgi:flagellar basal-body rod modification protein FlgD
MSIPIDRLAAASGLLRSAGADGYTPAGATSPGAGSQVASSDGASSIFGLGKDGYFKLFLAELQNQDPTNPMSNSDMVAQLAQFTMIETLQGVSDALHGDRLSQASGLIGRHVTGKDAEGNAVEGTVDSVQQAGTDLLLVVGSQTISPDDVLTVTAVTAASGETAGAGSASTAGSGTPAA